MLGLSMLAVLFGAVVQRVTGQGFGTVASAFIALLAPERIPAAVLLMGFAITLASARSDHSAIAWRELLPALLGRAAGTAPAVLLLTVLPGPEDLSVIVALVILLGVGLSLSGLRVAISDGSLFAAGALSGFMGALTSVGAPPMGLLYQREEARRMRATLNAFFLLGLTVSLAGVASAGRVGTDDALFAALMLPAAGIGVLAGGRIARRLDGAAIRPAVLALVTLAAFGLIARWAL